MCGQGLGFSDILLQDAVPFLRALLLERRPSTPLTSLPGWVTARCRIHRGGGGHLLGSGLFEDPWTHRPVWMEGTVPQGCSSPGLPGQR